MNFMQNRKVSISESQPDYSGAPPRLITKTMRHDGVLYLAGQGPKDSGVMFVSQVVEDDEATEVQGTNMGFTIRHPAALFKGDVGTQIKDCALSVGLDLNNHYCTAFIKWLLPKNERNKPAKEAVAWAMNALDAEIQECKPKFIVCFGKVPFDQIVELRINATDALGAWFWSEKYQCKVFLMEKPAILMFKQERLEQFRLLFRQVQRMITEGDYQHCTKNYQIIRNSTELRALVEMFKAENRWRLAVDCEWGGTTFIDGRLRTFQMCWDPGKAAVVRLRDEQDNYVFDVSYEEAGAILGEWLNQPHVKYIGHYISVDLPWMHRWLKLDWFRKTLMDTAFAMQVVDETAPMGLEWLAMYATNLGRYDLPLLLWKKEHPQKEEDGYAFIPDDVLLEYSLMDVDVTFQGYLWLLRRMEIEGVSKYYNEIFHPFVTDVFTSFVINGLPIDRQKMERLRKVYNFSYDILQQEFRKDMVVEAKFILTNKLLAMVDPRTAIALLKIFTAIIDSAGDIKLCLDNCDALTIEQRQTLLPVLEHMQVCPNFNIRSKPQMVRWLFEVKGHTPIKSTDNKPKGIRALTWEKVMALPPDKRKDYQPASDKQTLQILSEVDPMVDRLFDLNVVGNICNSFLKEAIYDEETDELVSECGLFNHLCSDDRIHNFYATTETGRPRTWKPNVLNWPSYVTKRLSKAIGRVMLKLEAKKELPDEFRKYLPDVNSDEPEMAKIDSIRSCVVPPPGWCIAESDYQTAEVRGLALLSGDKNLIKLMTERDPTFCLVKDGNDVYKVRTEFTLEWECGIPHERQFAYCLNAIWKNGKLIRKVDPSEFIRNPDGSLAHPKYDLHWSLAEMVYQLPRERMEEKIHRQVGKTGNFCLAEGQPVLTGRGWIPIEELLDCDVLWDGVEWCSHEGLHYSGYREVRSYGGLWATPGHNVWTEQGKINFEKARLEQVGLVEIGGAGQASECAWPDHFPGYDTEKRARVLRSSDGMYFLRKAGGEGSAEHVEGSLIKVPVSTTRGAGSIWCSDAYNENPGYAVRSHDAEVLQDNACFELQLSEQGYNRGVQESQGLCDLGFGDVAGVGLQEEGFRPHQQRRELLEGEFEVGITVGEFVEQAQAELSRYRHEQGIPSQTPGSEIHGQNVSGFTAAGVHGVADSGETQQEPESWMAKTYDVINVGPRRRFVCSGILVSNSTAYGASENSLERKIEADTGKKPEAGTGKKLLDALERRQPRAVEFLKELENIPRAKDSVFVAASGRKRRFHKHPSSFAQDNWRLVKSLLSALGREARNFPMQESVAATAARAGTWLLAAQMTNNLQGFTAAILYDSAVTICPENERHIWADLHELYLHRLNSWNYDGRILRYPIDTDFNTAWSVKASGDAKKRLNDVEYEKTPARLMPVLAWCRAQLKQAQ